MQRAIRRLEDEKRDKARGILRRGLERIDGELDGADREFAIKATLTAATVIEKVGEGEERPEMTMTRDELRVFVRRALLRAWEAGARFVVRHGAEAVPGRADAYRNETESIRVGLWPRVSPRVLEAVAPVIEAEIVEETEVSE